MAELLADMPVLRSSTFFADCIRSHLVDIAPYSAKEREAQRQTMSEGSGRDGGLFPELLLFLLYFLFDGGVDSSCSHLLKCIRPAPDYPKSPPVFWTVFLGRVIASYLTYVRAERGRHDALGLMFTCGGGPERAGTTAKREKVETCDPELARAMAPNPCQLLLPLSAAAILCCPDFFLDVIKLAMTKES